MKMSKTLIWAGAAVIALGLLGCGGEVGSPAETTEVAPAKTEDSATLDHAALAEAAVANADRPDEDRADDDSRKPVAVLSFIAPEPGMDIFEIEAGRGYYTELYSHIVGSDGSIIIQNPESFDSFLGDAVEVRLRDNRLPNVRATKSNFDALDANDNSVDLVTWILGPHELFFTPAGVDSLGDVDQTFAEIRRILKPGGAFVVMDHAAAAGSPETSGNTVHRIDPAIIKRIVAGAGFELMDESDVLANPDDMYDKNVFDPQVRRKTDRFLLKYKNPN